MNVEVFDKKQAMTGTYINEHFLTISIFKEKYFAKVAFSKHSSSILMNSKLFETHLNLRLHLG